MKHTLILLIVFLFSWGGGQTAQAMEIKKVLALSDVSVSGEGIYLKETVRQDNPNYLLLYFDLSEAKAQTFQILLKSGKKERRISYELKARGRKGEEVKGFCPTVSLTVVRKMT